MKMVIYQKGKKEINTLKKFFMGLITDHHKNTHHKSMTLIVSPQQVVSVSLNSFLYFRSNFQSESLITTSSINRWDKEVNDDKTIMINLTKMQIPSMKALSF